MPPVLSGTVFELRSEPWKGLQLDSMKIRQKRAEAAAQRLAGLAGWASSRCHGGESQMACGTLNMARLIAPPLLTKLVLVTQLIKQAVRFNRGKLFRPRLLPGRLFLYSMEILTKDNLSPAVGNLRGSGPGLPRGIAEPAEGRRRTVWRPRQQSGERVPKATFGALNNNH